MSRFKSSSFKNIQASQATAYAELHKSHSHLVATKDYFLYPTLNSGTFCAVDYTCLGKQNHEAPLYTASIGNVVNIATDPFDSLIAFADTVGSTLVTRLPTLGGGNLAFDPINQWKTDDIALDFHSTSSGILLSTNKSGITVRNLEDGGTIAFQAPGEFTDSKWSLSGQHLTAVDKRGIVSIFDIRQQRTGTTFETHKSTRHPVKHIHLSGNLVLTTTLLPTRVPEYGLHDLRNPGSPILKQQLTGATSEVTPTADIDRNIVYFTSKERVRFVEFGNSPTSNRVGLGDGIFSTSFDQPIQATALVPATSNTLNLMKGEIGRLLVLTSNQSESAVTPLSITVPRRQYIDFHADLFPPTKSRVAVQNGKSWVEGGDAQLELVPLCPISSSKLSAAPVSQSVVAPSAKLVSPAPTQKSILPNQQQDFPVSKPTQTPLVVSQSAAVPVVESTVTTNSNIAKKETNNAVTSSPPSVVPSKSTAEVAAKPAQPEPIAAASLPDRPLITKAAGIPFNLTWSRKFIAGKTSLKPDYHDVHNLSATLPPDTHLLKANSKYFLFPLSGPAGRIGIHKLADKGRLPVDIPAVINGVGANDFTLDPFDLNTVCIAGDDSKIRVFTIVHNQDEELVNITTPDLVLEDAHMDRISEIHYHPSVQNLLISVSEDHLNPTIRVWNTVSKSVLKTVTLPAETGLISNVSWSPDGDLLAVTTKKKRLYIIDPRSSNTLVSITSHDSIRPSRVTWISPNVIVTTGFSKGAMRELLAFKLDENAATITQIGKSTLDSSPAPLFISGDVDTGIIFLYARGERGCLMYQVQQEDTKNVFVKLPTFEHSDLQSGFVFFPKQENDVSSVEVMRSLRLTPNTVQVVSFTIPRARAEFFQDDIFIPTRNRLLPVAEAGEWLNSKDFKPRILTLRPKGMALLSEAPPTAAAISSRHKIAQGPVMTDSQKQDAYMERLFGAAKIGDADSEEDEEQTRKLKHSRPDDDDDW